MSEQRPRYQRSAAGLVGALIVTVAAILAFVALRDLVRSDVEVETETVDYLEAVEQAGTADIRAVHPPELPEGWRATSVDIVPGDRPAWGMGMLTAEGEFVGIRQADEDVEDLLERYVDEEPERRDQTFDLSEGPVATSWQLWTDAGGDTAYSADVGGETVLVYGSAPREEIQDLIGLLDR